MNLDPLLLRLKEIVNFTSEEFSAFADLVSQIQLDKGDQWERSGAVSQMMGFVNKGILRQFSMKDGEEYTHEFYVENDFVGNYLSYQTQTPSTMITEALEPSELIVIPFQLFESLYSKMPVTKEASDIVGNIKLMNVHNKNASLLMDSPKQRYYKLVEERPDLINRVSQYQIAQYLGIRPESLSRIRKRHNRS